MLLLQKGLEELRWERQKEIRGKTERVEVVVERGQGSSGERKGREAGVESNKYWIWSPKPWLRVTALPPASLHDLGQIT